MSPALETWIGWNQGNRAPSPIELGCADPNNPCTLPNALASDPFLEQVVSQTFELGARGRLADGLTVERGRVPQQQHGRHPVRQHQRDRHQRRLLHQLRQDPPAGHRAGAGRPVALAVRGPPTTPSSMRPSRTAPACCPRTTAPPAPAPPAVPTTSWSPPATTSPAFRRISST